MDHRPTVIALFSVVWLTCLGAFLSCCGPSVGTQTRVDYALEAAHCDEMERDIIAREGTTEEEDREAMELERVRCAAALSALLDGGVQ